MYLRTHIPLSPWRPAFPDFLRDLGHALRIIRRNPGYAVAAMLCLGQAWGKRDRLQPFRWHVPSQVAAA